MSILVDALLWSFTYYPLHFFHDIVIYANPGILLACIGFYFYFNSFTFDCLRYNFSFLLSILHLGGGIILFTIIAIMYFLIFPVLIIANFFLENFFCGVFGNTLYVISKHVSYSYLYKLLIWWLYFAAGNI